MIFRLPGCVKANVKIRESNVLPLKRTNCYTASSRPKHYMLNPSAARERERAKRRLRRAVARSSLRTLLRHDWPIRSKVIDGDCAGIPTRPTYTDLPTSHSYQHSLTTVIHSIRYHIVISCYFPLVVLCPLVGARWTWCSD